MSITAGPAAITGQAPGERLLLIRRSAPTDGIGGLMDRIAELMVVCLVNLLSTIYAVLAISINHYNHARSVTGKHVSSKVLTMTIFDLVYSGCCSHAA
ncbi:hypothetical protein AZE42_10973 [Rhizopogon vesiculosus]|uniref:Uncharacterized protein n=1 Tax=Rhizopogon vesiculosus TaxID=180088 RepID=A0A1J8QHT4_9AGAM|nr:hypothetical protein AZE42_10973 [Rhizopogon vesiculosus]